MDTSDGGHGADVQRARGGLPGASPRPGSLPRGAAPVAHPAQVGPGAEGGPGAGEEDGADVSPGGDSPQGAQEGFREGPVEGVAAPGPVQAQVQHASPRRRDTARASSGLGWAPE